MSNPAEPAAVEPAPEPTLIEKIEAIMERHKHDIVSSVVHLWTDLKELVAAEKAALAEFVEEIKADA